MAKRGNRSPRPRAFNKDGSPKGHRARVDSDDPYALRPPVPAGEAAPGTPSVGMPTTSGGAEQRDLNRNASLHSVPQEATPLKVPPMASGKLTDEEVERHARLAANSGGTVYSDGETDFSDSVALVVGVFAAFVAALGLITFGLFTATSGLFVAAAVAGLLLLLILFAVLTERVGRLGALIAAVVVLAVAVGVMFLARGRPLPGTQAAVEEDGNAVPTADVRRSEGVVLPSAAREAMREAEARAAEEDADEETDAD